MQLRKQLDDFSGKSDFITVFFEAWRFQSDENPIAALLHEISTQMATSPKVLDVFQKEGLALLRSLEFELKLFGSGMKYSGEKHHQATEEMKGLSTSEVTRQALKRTIDAILRQSDGSSNRRLVIFVDDLDRCEPATIKSLLEAIKIYLNLDSAIVVLAINDHRLSAAFNEDRKKEGNEDSAAAEALAREYLNKIATEVWRVPLVPTGTDLKLQIVETAYDSNLAQKDPGKLKIAKAICSIADQYQILATNPRQHKRFAHTVLTLLSREQGLNLPLAIADKIIEGKIAPTDDYTDFLAYTLSCYTYLAFPRLYESLVIHDIMAPLLEVSRDPRLLKDRAKDYPVLSTIKLGTYPEPSSPEYFRAISLVTDLGSRTVRSLKEYAIT
jgi:hypothetical protein